MNESATPPSENTTDKKIADPDLLFGKEKSALIIEDDPTSGKLIDDLLTKHGFGIVKATDGNDAWAKILAQPSFHIIVSDFLMPEMDGFQFLKKIKGHPGLQSIPVVFISARKNIADSLLVSGADAFFPKPLDTESFIEKIRRLLNRAAPTADTAAKPETTEPPSS